MHFAAREGDQEMVQLLLAAGVNVNILSEADAVPQKVPLRPTPNGGIDFTGRLAIGGRKTAGTNGYTPLLVATVRGQVPLALFLLDHGADPNIVDAGFTPLHWASTEWESFTANRVYGFDRPDGRHSGSPGQAAAGEGSAGAWRKSERAHDQDAAAVSRADTRTRSAQRLSCSPASADDLEMMKILLEAGADPKQGTATNATAIMAATGLNHGIGESPVTEAQALACGQISARSWPRSEGRDNLRRERVVRSRISRLEHAARRN